MNKKGITLVELSVVIVVLSLIIVVAGKSLTENRRQANIEEAKKIEGAINALGTDVYLKNGLTKNIYDVSELTGFGLKYPIKNPSGDGECYGYLEIEYNAEFNAYICCPGVYETNSDDTTNCQRFNKELENKKNQQ